MRKRVVFWATVLILLAILAASFPPQIAFSQGLRKVYLPSIRKTWIQPEIQLTYIPPYKSFDRLRGKVDYVNPTNFKVAVYIYVGGWWTKPYWTLPLTTINSDGSWSCNVTTGGNDQLATKFAAFLVPNGYNPPLMAGGTSFPEELFIKAVAWTTVEREAIFRKIQFSGYTWKVKASETQAGPGPNYFSDQENDVWVDNLGRLHLRIVKKNSRWYCTEVITERTIGYGKYIFHLASQPDLLDKNIVLGLFTWDEIAPEYNFREIDIEFARWNQEGVPNTQYVIQPWDRSGNINRFSLTLPQTSTHGFEWRPSRVFFQSLSGFQSFPGPSSGELKSWNYTGQNVPPEGGGNARINFWLSGGIPPANSQTAEVIIESFEFTAQTED